jgi:hypothetical protein
MSTISDKKSPFDIPIILLYLTNANNLKRLWRSMVGAFDFRALLKPGKPSALQYISEGDWEKTLSKITAKNKEQTI